MRAFVSSHALFRAFAGEHAVVKQSVEREPRSSAGYFGRAAPICARVHGDEGGHPGIEGPQPSGRADIAEFRLAVAREMRKHPLSSPPRLDTEHRWAFIRRRARQSLRLPSGARNRDVGGGPGQSLQRVAMTWPRRSTFRRARRWDQGAGGKIERPGLPCDAYHAHEVGDRRSHARRPLAKQ